MTVGYAISGAVATITIDRPAALNAMDLSTQERLRAALVEARDDMAVRVIVITGAGEKSFSTGSDLKGIPVLPEEPAAAWVATDDRAPSHGAYVRRLNFQSLDLWKPMIAAINGFCIGGGLEIALQCDLRVASEAASFSLPEVKIGSVAGICGPLLHRLIPSAHAMKLLLTGARIDAAEALRIGLISDVWPQAEFQGRVAALAAQIAENAPLSLGATKRLIRETETLPRDMLFSMTELVFGLLKQTEDRAEGRLAFAEKRKPRFVGK